VDEQHIGAAPAAGTHHVTLTLEATGAPVGYTVQVLAVRHARFGGWIDEGDITASLSPSPTSPPTSPTDYTYASGFSAQAGVTLNLVEYVFTVKIFDAGSAEVATKDIP
jgi:hypothetical protein